MSIKINNLRISPYSDKDTLKVVFGDTMELTFKIPHVDGESYLCGLDNERVVYPPSRPICAYTEQYTRDGDDVTFSLKLTTSKLRDYVSSIRKPMPVWLQVVRVVNGRYETVLLDDILALPSVIDGAMTVCEGDPLKELLEAKMDKPTEEGTAGQVLTMGDDGHYAWADLPEIPEQAQADWDVSDSTDVAYIKNKPDLNVYVEKVEGKGLSTNDYTTEDKTKLEGIEDGAQVNVQADWDVSDSGSEAYIRNKPSLATVATTGSYNDLTDKPTIPEQVQADWDESDSSEASFIKNKPVIPEDAMDYLRFTAAQSNSTVRLDKVGSPDAISLEYSTDKVNWTEYTWTDSTGATITLASVGDSVWFRGTNTTMASYQFVMSNKIKASGNIMSLLDKELRKTNASSYCFQSLFGNCTSLITAPELPATTLAQGCYNLMFQNCTSLITAPELPATTLANDCYRGMFQGCTSLKSTPVLPATYVERYSYYNMFNRCTSLTSVTMNATSGMRDVGQLMLGDCSSLKHIKVMFTKWQFTYGFTAFSSWLYNAPATGVFECPSALDCSTRDDSHVPAGWTIVRYDAPWSDWDESDSTEASFILNKPVIPDAQVQANWDESDSTDLSYIQNKPVIPQPVPQVQADWDESDSSELSYIQNKPHIPADQVQADWDESDSSDVSFIQNKPTIPQPVPQVQSDWDESDSMDVSFIQNKPVLPNFASIETSLDNYEAMLKAQSLRYQPLCVECLTDWSPILITSRLNQYDFNIEFSWDNKTWIPTEWSNGLIMYRDANNNLTPIVVEAAHATYPSKVYLRGFNTACVIDPNGSGKCLCITGNPGRQDATFKVSGNPLSMLDGTGFGTMNTVPQYALALLFYQFTQLVDASELVMPAMNLGEYCYQGMFYQCATMTTAPYLPATNLSPFCYGNMFNGCSALQNVSVGFTDWYGSLNATVNWLNSVSGTGTFKCPSLLDTSNRSVSTVPSGWTVQNI